MVIFVGPKFNRIALKLIQKGKSHKAIVTDSSDSGLPMGVTQIGRQHFSFMILDSGIVYVQDIIEVYFIPNSKYALQYTDDIAEKYRGKKKKTKLILFFKSLWFISLATTILLLIFL